jgi:MFS family permease
MVPDRNETANDADASPFSDNAGNPTPLAPVLLSVFTVMLGLGIIASLLPVYARTLGADGWMLGIIFSVFSLFRTLLTPVTGILSDRWGRKHFMLAGLAAYCLVSLAYIRADSIPLLILVRVLHGMAAALVIPAANAHVGDLAPRNPFAGIDPVFYACAGFLAAAVLFGFRFLDGHH